MALETCCLSVPPTDQGVIHEMDLDLGLSSNLLLDYLLLLLLPGFWYLWSGLVLAPKMALKYIESVEH